MHSSPLDRYRLAFLIGVPLAWAVLLAFHGAPDPDDIYGSLSDEATRFLIVHVGGLLFIGLMGVALYLLVQDLPGRAARISRWAIGPFVLFYAAAEAIGGVATGVLVREDEGDGAQALWDNFITGDLFFGLGALSWVVASISAAVAYRRVGASLGVVILLGLSALVAYHAPPIGPIGLLCFAGAVAMVARNQTVLESADTRQPALAGPS